MKKWLTILLMCLLMLPAQAAETEITPAWLEGVWRFEGGAEVCGYGFRLDADGSLTWFSTDDFESFPPQRLIPTADKAAWQYRKGKLTITGEGSKTSYPLSFIPERSAESGCDTIHLAEGDGGGFYRRGDETHVVALGAPIPRDVLYAVEEKHPDYRLEGYCELADTPMGHAGFALIRCGHGRRLYGFRQEKGEWVCFLDTVKAVPQNDAAEVVLGASAEGGSYSRLWFDADKHGDLAPQGPTVGVLTTNGESYEAQVTYSIQADGLRLAGWGLDAQRMADVVGDRLVFYGIGDAEAAWAPLRFDTAIGAVDFAALPQSAAQAESYAGPGAAEEMYHTLCRLWHVDMSAPEPALGGGVYFRVDGTCLLYDAGGAKEGFASALALREEGTWSVTGDTLTVVTGGERIVLPVRLLTEKDWHYHGGVGLGAGRYLPSSPEYAGLTPESVMPEAIRGHIRAFHPDDLIEGYAELPNAPGGPMAFVLIKNEYRRQLNIFRLENGRWDEVEDVEEAIPQGEHEGVSLGVSREGGSYENSLWYDPDRDGYTYPAGPLLHVNTDNGEYVEEFVTFVLQEEGIYLLSYGDGPNTQIDVAGDDLVFYNISYGYDGKARRDFSTDILAVDFYALPRAITDVKLSGVGEPAMPQTDAENALVVQDVKLRADKKYPVYMGPGKAFGRAAGGKASVSTNGWVQVFGEYDGWLLIHYAINAEQYRFGWITKDALARGEKAPRLPLTFGDMMTVEETIDLMDDPVNSRTALAQIPRGATVERLAQLGDGYSLVRVKLKGKTWWGFVYSWPLGHG